MTATALMVLTTLLAACGSGAAPDHVKPADEPPPSERGPSDLDPGSGRPPAAGSAPAGDDGGDVGSGRPAGVQLVPAPPSADDKRADEDASELQLLLDAVNASLPAEIVTTLQRMRQCLQRSSRLDAACATTWDEVMCWPESKRGYIVTIPCFNEFNGVLYHGKNNASRYCREDGVWEERANYSNCMQSYTEMPFTVDANVRRSEHTSLIYLTGYSLSLVALTLATWIFSYCKDLRCLRNTIHANLFTTYILTDSLWIISLSLELLLAHSTWGSCVITVLLYYCHVSTFFWMFVEGHYLYMLVVQTFSADKLRCRLYIVIGWGVPLMVMATWALVKIQTTEIGSRVAAGHRSQLETLGFEDHMNHELMYAHCPWLQQSGWDWLYMGPTIVILSFNCIFLIRIMWVLITKLRSTNSAETQQYKKATKALLVLLPLLGLTYFLVFSTPTSGLMAHVFVYLQAILISTQGLTVALIYCFFNSEVRASIKTHYQRWRMKKSLGRSTKDSLRPFHVHRRPSSATEMTCLNGDSSVNAATSATAAKSVSVDTPAALTATAGQAQLDTAGRQQASSVWTDNDLSNA